MMIYKVYRKFFPAASTHHYRWVPATHLGVALNATTLDAAKDLTEDCFEIQPEDGEWVDGNRASRYVSEDGITEYTIMRDWS